MKMNKKNVILITAALVAATFVAGCGSSTNNKNDNKVLHVGTEPTFPPFESSEDDKYVGFDMEYTKAIADKLGMKQEIKPMGFDALIPALKSGQIDIIAAGMNSTPERAKQVAFTNVYFRGGFVIVVSKDNSSITDWDSLAGKNVGAQLGTKSSTIAQEKGANVKQIDTNSQGWMELQAKSCDAIIIDNAVAMHYIANGGQDNLKIVGDPIESTDYAMAINKDNKELLDKVNKAMTDLKADGTYAKLYKKWFGQDPQN